MNYNKVIVVGNVTRDPELKALPSGIKVATLSIATNRYWTKDGQKQEEVEFHNITLFGTLAENVATYMKRGSSLLVEGRLQTRSWDKDGVKHYRTEIIGEQVQFGSNKTVTTSSTPEPKSVEKQVEQDENNVIDYPEEEINPDDIPF